MGNGLNWSVDDLANYNSRTAGYTRGAVVHVRDRAEMDRLITPLSNPLPMVQVPAPRKNKYGATKTATADSLKESRRQEELKLLREAGEIRDLFFHVTYELIPRQVKEGGAIERAVKYTCDAQYVDVETGRLVVEDSKSHATCKAKDWHMRRKLMLERYGIEVRVV
jgi:hypothetical protein